MRNIIRITFIFTLVFILGACSKKAKEQNTQCEHSEERAEIEHIYRFGICIDSLDVNEYQIKSGDNLSKIYSDFGFSGREIDRIVKASSNLLPPKSLLPGTKYYSFTTQEDTLPKITNIVFARSKTDFVVIDLTADSIKADTFKKPVTIKRKYSEGTVETCLWDAIVASGTDPIIALKLSDIYAWQIDFFGIQKGDAFKVIYDAAYIDDTIPLNVESVEGAIFTHNKKDYIAVPFVQDDARIFFDENGNSLRRAFLKSPLDFFRITSKFTNSRYHPVLKRYRPHHGVDYAAPVGTPVKTIGDGVVIDKGFQKNGGGYYLKIKHNSVYTTTYMHLSRYAKGIQKGSRVKQGEVVAYVGSTGLSTGPHLDFRVHKNGTPINPLTMEAPADIPVKPELSDSFMIVKQGILNEIAFFNTVVNDTTQLLAGNN
ncbi:metalloendopeptidase [Paludibacter sp. 221]|uniref:M23 family metallopeptidase n=1 Tax=Paludibacter sp. 221 TaxID=2302939 RepID=UPI0013D53AFF|nr:peptidoglycan DD-metalloendopeptidase family protein [Paludibacter sp. 221]NDV47713.1 metalloendopeptidase [Paludibacter sp. 221]